MNGFFPGKDAETPILPFDPLRHGRRPILRRCNKRGAGYGVIVTSSSIGTVHMIKRYSDHAANERTFLAWVRTAIAVMAFGFVIERFDLFLQVIAPQVAGRQISAHGQLFANVAGLAFIGIGIAMIAIAMLRFARTAKAIDSDDELPSVGQRFDIGLAVLIGLLGIALFLYLSRAVLPAI
jgi:putative membrane protein